MAQLRSVLSIVTLALSCSHALAHPVPAARATLEFHTVGTFELLITCDVSALVMQTTPGHLGPAAAELQALDEPELQARVDDAKQAVEHYLQLKLNGARRMPQTIEFPPLAVIRSSSEHDEDDDWPEIVLRGAAPAVVNSFDVTFPASLGRVRLRLVRAGELLLERDLRVGESSGVLRVPATNERMPSRSAADRTGWVLVALLLVYLVWLVVREASRYSRNTSTGQ